MISNGKVVTLDYLLATEDGEELDRSESSEPFIYLHGFNQIVPGLEKALSGLKIGDKKKVVVAPKDGYGEVIQDLILTVERKQFPADVKLQEGMEFSADIGGGRMVNFTVMGVKGDQVEINGNHPLAGVTLVFTVEIQGVRDATKEELEHGHAHGPGGHHH